MGGAMSRHQTPNTATQAKWQTNHRTEWRIWKNPSWQGPTHKDNDFKLRINLRDEDYLTPEVTESVIQMLLSVNHDDCISGFKTFNEGIFKTLPAEVKQRFNSAGQFTIYLKDSATSEQIKQLTTKIERALFTLKQGHIMPGDTKISRHVSMRRERMLVPKAWKIGRLTQGEDDNTDYIDMTYVKALGVMDQYQDMLNHSQYRSDLSPTAYQYNKHLEALYALRFTMIYDPYVRAEKGLWDRNKYLARVYDLIGVHLTNMLDRKFSIKSIMISYQAILKMKDEGNVRVITALEKVVDNFIRQRLKIRPTVISSCSFELCINPVMKLCDTIKLLSSDEKQLSHFIESLHHSLLSNPSSHEKNSQPPKVSLFSNLSHSLTDFIDQLKCASTLCQSTSSEVDQAFYVTITKIIFNYLNIQPSPRIAQQQLLEAIDLSSNEMKASPMKATYS